MVTPSSSSGRRRRGQAASRASSSASSGPSSSTSAPPQRPATQRKRQLSSASSDKHQREASSSSSSSSSSAAGSSADHRTKKPRLSLPVPSLGLGRIGRSISGGLRKLVKGSSADDEEATSEEMASSEDDELDVERTLMGEGSTQENGVKASDPKGKAKQPPDDDADMLDPDAEEDAGDEDDDDDGDRVPGTMSDTGPFATTLPGSTAHEARTGLGERERMARLSPESFSHRQMESTLMRSMRRRDEAASLLRPHPSRTTSTRSTSSAALPTNGELDHQDAPSSASSGERQPFVRDPPLRDPLAEAHTPPPEADELLEAREAARRRIRAILGEGRETSDADSSADATMANTGSSLPSPLGLHGDSAYAPPSSASSASTWAPHAGSRLRSGAQRPSLVLPLPRNPSQPGGSAGPHPQPPQQQPSALMALMNDILGMNSRLAARAQPSTPRQAAHQAAAQARARQAMRRAQESAAAAAAAAAPGGGARTAPGVGSGAPTAGQGLGAAALGGSGIPSSLFGNPLPSQQGGVGSRPQAGTDGVRPQTPSPSTAAGGTTVIVQGALVSRTLPPRRQQDRGTNTDSRRRASSAGPETSSAPHRAQRTYGSASSGLPSGDAAGAQEGSGTASNGGAAADDELGQAATLEEQATMLSRLLSLATAATAASLITGGGVTHGVAVLGRPGGSTAAAPGGTAPTPNRAGSGSISASGRGTLSSLRERLFSFGRGRPRSETTEATATESTAPPPSQQQQQQQQRQHVATGGTGETQGPLGALTQMLRDAIRDGFHTTSGEGSRAAEGENGQGVPSTSSTDSAERPGAARANLRRTASSGRIHIGRRATTASVRNTLTTNRASSGPQPSTSYPFINRPRPSSASVPPSSSSSTEPSPEQAPSTPSTPDVASLRAQHETQAAAVNATLERIRAGTVREGEPGSFDRFLYDLDNDLRAAVRVLPFDGSGSNSDDAEGQETGESSAEGAEILDDSDGPERREGTEAEALMRERRSRDVQAGQLSFFRLFRFPAGSAAWGVGPTAAPAGVATTVGGTMGGAPNTRSTSVGSTPPMPGAASAPPSTAGATAAPPNATGATPNPNPGGPQAVVLAPQLVPCVVVGVRSLASHETLPGENGAPAAATGGGGARGNAAPARGDQTQETQANVGRSSGNSAGPSTRSQGRMQSGTTPSSGSADGNANTNANATSTSRYLLFVSGGAYHPSHPLLTATSEQATRDLMLLMEVMSAMAAAQASAYKAQTASQEQIDRSNLRNVRGEEMKELVRKGEVKENTSEKCLICLEDWTDEDQVRVLSCLHAFHTPCVDKWITASSNSCPLCRANAVNTQQQQQPSQGGNGDGSARTQQGSSVGRSTAAL